MKEDSLDPPITTSAKLSDAKNATDVKYKRRFQDSTLSADTKAILLNECVKEGHPIAMLEKAEGVFEPFVGFGGVCEPHYIPTTCDGSSLGGSKGKWSISFERSRFFPSPTEETYSTCTTFAKEALHILNSEKEGDYAEYFPFLPEFIGLLGLRPHILSKDPRVILLYWEKEFQNAQIHLTKKDEGEVLIFADRYPTTVFWLQALKNPENSGLVSQVNRFLQCLDCLPQVHPWWRDPAWKKRSE